MPGPGQKGETLDLAELPTFASCETQSVSVGRAPMRPRGGVVTQRIANPCTGVRFPPRPPNPISQTGSSDRISGQPGARLGCGGSAMHPAQSRRACHGSMKGGRRGSPERPVRGVTGELSDIMSGTSCLAFGAQGTTSLFTTAGPIVMWGVLVYSPARYVLAPSDSRQGRSLTMIEYP